jgi:hypothetical protein
MLVFYKNLIKRREKLPEDLKEVLDKDLYETIKNRLTILEREASKRRRA